MPNITPDKLHFLLFEQKKTLKEASRELDVHRTTIDKLLAKYKVLYPDLFPSRKPKPKIEDKLSPEKLMNLWGKIPTKQIAIKYGVTPQYLYQLIGEYRKTHPEWFPKLPELSVSDMEGKTIAQIHKETGRSDKYIKRRKRELGLTRKPLSSYLDRKSLQDLFDDGFSVSKVADEYGVTYEAIYRLARNYGLSIPKMPREPFKHFTDEEKKYIAEAKAEGQSIVQVAQALGRTTKAITQQFAKLENRKNHVTVRIPEEELEEDYVIFGKSPEQIAKERGLTVVDVETNIKRYKMKQ